MSLLLGLLAATRSEAVEWNSSLARYLFTREEAEQAAADQEMRTYYEEELIPEYKQAAQEALDNADEAIARAQSVEAENARLRRWLKVTSIATLVALVSGAIACLS